MNNLTKPTATAARVLREHPDLPVAAIAIGWTSSSDGVAVQLQMPPRDEGVAVAAWARALDTTVTLRGEDTYVWLGAVAEVDGCTVQAWNHLDLRTAAEVTTRIGVPLPAEGEAVQVDSAVFEPAAGTTTGTAAA
jgi:hypothetical protein